MTFKMGSGLFLCCILFNLLLFGSAKASESASPSTPFHVTIDPLFFPRWWKNDFQKIVQCHRRIELFLNWTINKGIQELSKINSSLAIQLSSVHTKGGSIWLANAIDEDALARASNEKPIMIIYKKLAQIIVNGLCFGGSSPNVYSTIFHEFLHNSGVPFIPEHNRVSSVPNYIDRDPIYACVSVAFPSLRHYYESKNRDFLYTTKSSCNLCASLAVQNNKVNMGEQIQRGVCENMDRYKGDVISKVNAISEELGNSIQTIFSETPLQKRSGPLTSR